VVLSINPGARLVEISQDIDPGSVLQAASLLRETFIYFPSGTVHLAVVDPGVGGDRRPIAVEAAGHLFVGPDNGIFWPIICDHQETKTVHLTERKYFLPHVSSTFHGRDLFSPVAAHLSAGVTPEGMGAEINDPVELALPTPQRKGGILYGEIVRMDNFGNLITNIHRRELDHFLKSEHPVIKVGNLVTKRLGHVYSDAEEGEALALMNSSDWLEIAVNLGRASEDTGIDSAKIIGAVVKVEKS
jgi:S-adenosylmethionine hydrolase